MRLALSWNLLCMIFITVNFIESVFPQNKSHHDFEENPRILEAASEKMRHVSFPKEQLTPKCLSAAYNKWELSGCTKRSLTQTLESLAPELKASCYWSDWQEAFQTSVAAAAFCVSDLVSAARKPSKSLYAIRQTVTRGVLSLKRQGKWYFSETLF